MYLSAKMKDNELKQSAMCQTVLKTSVSQLHGSEGRLFCPQCRLCVLSLPNTSTTEGARFATTGVEGSGEVTAFTFGLLKTGDKKSAARKESRILKDVIYHLCQERMKNSQRG